MGACGGFGLYSYLHGALPKLRPLSASSLKPRLLLLAFVFLGFKAFQFIGYQLFADPEELRRL